MVVTERGEDVWRGTEASDLDEYVAAYAAATGYAVDRVVHAVCALCGNGAFGVLVDDTEGVAGRHCLRCDDRRWMLDSAEALADATLEEAQCPCGGEVFDAAVGFSLRALPPAPGDVRWVYVGLRCLACGLLGVYADWDVDYSPSGHLLTAV